MQRRDFLKSATMAGSSLLWAPHSAFSLQSPVITPAPDPAVKHVLVMFKCHFDAGFIDTQAHVVQRYFTEYFPHAMQIAEEMRQSGNERYVWTTGSWLLYEYLEQASAEDRKRMEQAIQRGDIAWHALPFTWQTELIDRSMIEGSLGLSQSLDRRFGRTTTGAKMTDVPGHTRGLIAPLAGHGVKFLDIGVNDASTPAELPPLFTWKDSRGETLSVMYHHGYGGVTRVPGSDLAVAIVVRDDNSGPHSPEEIRKVYARLKDQFPNAEVTPTNLTEIANAVDPFHSHLPVITQEIGDSWIHGVASDPLKLARYREVARLRERWIAQKKFGIGDTTDVAMLRRVLLEAEHTWGTDTKTWLDFDHYTPKDLASMLETKNYKVVEFSWEEKRKDLFDGISALPAQLQNEAQQAVRALEAKKPSMVAGSPHSAENEIESKHFVVGIDAKTGAIRKLRNKKTEREWASADHPLALFSYQTLSQKDYTQFFTNYVVSDADWAKKDFGKPNIERYGAESQEWLPSLTDLHVAKDAAGHRILAQLEIKDAAALNSGRAAFPQDLYLELVLPDAAPEIHLNFYWFGKPATRMPEAIWLTFNPQVKDPQGWMMEKSGEPVSPFDVAVAGGRHLHAVSPGIHHKDGDSEFRLELLDAPVIALGEKSPLNFSRTQPDLSGGVHCNLFNNAWGTNYIMWFGEDMRFRFIVRA
ncbi:DUF5054 domain-containing protein [Acidobacterium sp. S8]|uniref:DUF5054 domain-containing protein n=1 Tax=Acidobacterium sp. S8 TaxID=1641854 RepID=UPI00131D2859|nr:DUF5054 domain-containing protein [Acidobacterium sp. S8]